ncbi:MAG: cupin domain-containing protein [Sphingobacteriales bacterium]|nr:MAG: cupin domain-containing protein [Sphingobacteriales bacterium]
MNLPITNERTIFNPVQNDWVTFLEMTSENGGARTLVELIIAPGGKVGMHYHKAYAETFTCYEGELGVQVGTEKLVLITGDAPVTAGPGDLHQWYNAGDKPCRCTVEITPGCRGFEEAIQIAYGLARDGKVTKDGTPRSVKHLGFLLLLSESKLPGWRGLIEKAFLRIGRRVEKKGIGDRLRKQYVRY